MHLGLKCYHQSNESVIVYRNSCLYCIFITDRVFLTTLCIITDRVSSYEATSNESLLY